MIAEEDKQKTRDVGTNAIKKSDLTIGTNCEESKKNLAKHSEQEAIWIFN